MCMCLGVHNVYVSVCAFMCVCIAQGGLVNTRSMITSWFGKYTFNENFKRGDREREKRREERERERERQTDREGEYI